jgi:beta-glucosidase
METVARKYGKRITHHWVRSTTASVGDSTRQVLHRLQHGLVDGISPKLVVLKIGTNNLYGDHNAGSDEEIAAGITSIVKTLRQKLPQTKILLLGVLPRQNDYFSNRAKRINESIARLDDGKNVRFLDISAKFQTEVGKVVPALYSGDQLHLAKPGYEMWSQTMSPLFNEMMK